MGPHLVGDALVAELLVRSGLRDVPAHRPSDIRERVALSALLPSLAGFQTVESSTKLHEECLNVDGMHELDCAIVLRDSVIPVEAKLGDSGLPLKSFRKRFLGEPKLTHRGRALGGSIPAILDHNGRTIAGGQTKIRLHALLPGRSTLVQPQWVLVIADSTREKWSRKASDVASALGTRQLAAIVVLEDLVHIVGLSEATSVAEKLLLGHLQRWKKAWKEHEFVSLAAPTPTRRSSSRSETQ